MELILRELSKDSTSDIELNQKFIQRFGKNISVHITLASQQAMPDYIIALHKAFNGLTLKNPLTWVQVSISGLVNQMVLEF